MNRRLAKKFCHTGLVYVLSSSTNAVGQVSTVAVKFPVSLADSLT